MSATVKTIAIVGATGTQGSSVSRTFLSVPGWRVRCLTRTPDSAKSQALVSLGAEVVKADLDDPQSLNRAFSGAHAIFINTDFWIAFRTSGEDFKAAFELELRRGKNAVDAAARVTSLERLVYSALGPMRKASGGKYFSYFWESKAAVVDHIEEQYAGLAAKTSFLYLGAYVTNPVLLPKLDPQSGEYLTILPRPADGNMKVGVIKPIGSTGLFVRALVEDEQPRTKLFAYDAGNYMTMQEVVDAWCEVTGKKARIVTMESKEIQKMTGVADEVLLGPMYMVEYGYMAGIEGYIEPAELKKQIVAPTYRDFLKSQTQDYLLGTSAGK
jgi:NAD(P)-dependent dehydrogenase (short-subunit alcohol dehydrogenase family)